MMYGSKTTKMSGAMKCASEGRVKKVAPPANPLKTYGQMQPGDKR